MKKRRISLSARAYTFLTFILLELSAGLIFIGYRAGSRQIDDAYYKRAELAIASVIDAQLDDRALYLYHNVNTEEYARIRQEAEASGDESLISSWMDALPDFAGRTESDGGTYIKDELLPFSMYTDYLFLKDSLQYLKNLFHLSSAYIEYDLDDVTYILVNSEDTLLLTGRSKEEDSVFADFEDNAAIPPTVFEENGQWFLATCEPIYEKAGGEAEGPPVCLVGVDIDMTDIMRDRRNFIKDSLLFVILLSAANILIAIFMMRSTITKRITNLANAVTSFADRDDNYTKEKVVGADTGQNDEIRDLYDATRSMQLRMIDYTEDLTRITAEKERINTELKLAEQIQKNAIPATFPPFPDRTEFALHANMDPAREVGGDFYDYFLIDEQHLALVIADVSGKGVPAALFMMSAKTMINYRARKGGSTGEILRSVNRQLSRDNRQCMFVTVWLGILDLGTGILTHSNAGHLKPVILRRDGRAEFIRTPHDLFMGIQKEETYHDYTTGLEDGDTLYVYTDGVTEAIDTEERQFGDARLLAAFDHIDRSSPERIIADLRQEVAAFTKGAEQFDDITMLCLQYRGTQ